MTMKQGLLFIIMLFVGLLAFFVYYYNFQHGQLHEESRPMIKRSEKFFETERGARHIHQEEVDTAMPEKRKAKYGTIIGIDLGTTYSSVGVFKNGAVEIIANELGNRITPSMVAWAQDHVQLYIGDAAKNQLIFNPENTFFDVKRLIGRDFDDSVVQRDIRSNIWPFKIINDNKNKPVIKVKTNKNEYATYHPEFISGMVLSKMKKIAEDFVGMEVENAVVTVPAYFNDAQRQATKDAAKIAGLNVVRILNEPTAAAIAYGIQNLEGQRNILVYDLGGGTFDVSILQVNKSDFKVLAINGDTHFGGTDFDWRVTEYYLKEFEKKTKKDARNNKRSVERLRQEVEKAKRHLSAHKNAAIAIDGFYDGEDFYEVLTQARFEELNMDYFTKTLTPVKQALNDSGLLHSDINEIIMVGGSTRIVKLRKMLEATFPGVNISTRINPDEAVAYGAAYLAGALGGEEEARNLKLLDVNPLTLGIAATNTNHQKTLYMSEIIPRNTFIPTTKWANYTTVFDNQVSIHFQIYEGERPLVEDNHYLGGFLLKNIEIAKAGVPKINVTFALDLNGILHVSAKDMRTGSAGFITISNDHNRLSPEDIERNVEEAKRYADQDNKIKKQVAETNSYGSYLVHLQTLLVDKIWRCKMLSKQERSIEAEVEKSIAWLKEMDPHQLLLLETLQENRKNLEGIVLPIYDHIRSGICSRSVMAALKAIGMRWILAILGIFFNHKYDMEDIFKACTYSQEVISELESDQIAMLLLVGAPVALCFTSFVVYFTVKHRRSSTKRRIIHQIINSSTAVRDADQNQQDSTSNSVTIKQTGRTGTDANHTLVSAALPANGRSDVKNECKCRGQGNK